ncbi:hypothetical protein Tco_0341392 [Tanacetum coccineum]
MSTPAYVDLETITLVKGAQSSRVPIPLPDDPYVAVRQVQLVDTESEPEEAPSVAEELQSLGSRVPPMGEEFKAFEPSEFRITGLGRISSYETPSPSSSPTIPVRKRYRGIYELILDTDSEGDELGEEDKKDESSDAGDERESQGLDDEGRGLGDEDHGLDYESQGLEDEELGLEEEEVIPEGPQQVVPVVGTAVSEPFGLGYGALRRRELAVGEDQAPSTFEIDPEDGRVYTDIPAYVPLAAPAHTPLSPEWSLGSLPVSPSFPIVPSPIALPVATPRATISVDEDQFIEVGAQLEIHGSILHDHTQRLDAQPPTLVANIDRDVREMYTRSGAVRDEIFS